MSILKRLFSFYVFSNIHVSIAAFCLVKISLAEHEISDNTIPYFVLISTMVSYNFIRFYQINEINKSVSKWMISNKKSLILLNVVGLMLLVVLTFKIKSTDVLILIPFVFATVFYVVPLSKKKKNLRSISSLKLFLIAFSWAGITVMFPLIHHDIGISTDGWIVFIQRFLIMIALAIPFDIRDFNFDKEEIRTLPQTIGIRNSKYVGYTVLLLFLALEFLRNSNEQQLIALFVITIASFFLLVYAKKDQNRNYTSFWVEAIPIFWYLLIILFEKYAISLQAMI